MIFLGLVVKKEIDQGKAFAQAEELAMYGPQGNPEKREMPNDWNIHISGAIEPEVNYKIVASYSAESDKRTCKSWNLFSSSLIADSKTFTYSPKIQNGHHNLKIPLMELDPDAGCKYKIHYVRICFENNIEGAGACHYLFVNGFPNGIGYGFKFKEAINNTINIECTSQGNDSISGNFSPCGQQPVKQENSITQYFPSGSEKFVVNISTLDPAQYKIDLLLDSTFYKKKVRFIKNKYAKSTIENKISIDSEKLKSDLSDQHKLLKSLLEEVYAENEKLLEITKACSDCNLDSEKVIVPYFDIFTNAIKRAQKIRVIEEKLIYDQDTPINDSSLSTILFDDVFSHHPYYFQQIKFLFLKQLKADNGDERIDVLERVLKRDIAKLPIKLRQATYAYHDLLRQIKACEPCNPNMATYTESIIKKLSIIVGLLTGRRSDSVIGKIQLLEMELLINN